MSFVKRFLALATVICMILGISVITVNADTSNRISSSEFIIKKGNLKLCVDKETGQFSILDNSSNSAWYSTPQNLDTADMKNSKKSLAKSLLIITVLDNIKNDASITVSSQSGSVKNEAPKITQKKDTIRIEYYFDEYSFTVPIDIKLTEYGFSAVIVGSEIKEDTEQYSIKDINLLPYFNAGYYEENGFMLVPDGSGAIINFNNGRGDYSEYNGQVYGRDYAISLLYDQETEARVEMPYFGISHDNSYHIGFISSGAANATIKAVGNALNNLYNNCSPIFSLKSMDYFRNEGKWQDVEIYQKSEIPDVTMSVDYILGTANSPDYCEMAKALRSYLEKNYEFKADTNTSALEISLVGATLKKKMFLGIPSYRKEKLTDFKSAKKIIETLYDEGIEDVRLIYKKWSKNTVEEKMKASSSATLLGGKKELEDLKESVNSKGGKLYLEVSPLYVKSGNSILSGFSDYAQSIFGNSVKLYDYKPNTYAQNTKLRTTYLIKHELIEKQLLSWETAVKKLNVDGILFSNTNCMYSDFRKQSSSKFDFEKVATKAIAKLKSNVVNCGGSFCALPYSDYITGISSTYSGFDLEDMSVPFMQLVLHGLINYSSTNINAQSNYIDAYLRAVETGAALSFIFTDCEIGVLEGSEDSELSYSSFKLWKNDVADMYLQYKDFYNSIKKSNMVSHRKISDNCYCTKYANGCYSIVNYNDFDVATDFGTVKAKSYIVGEYQ